MQRDADITPCGCYRWSLGRTWDRSKDPLLFVMLNPSTADAMKDDPTIRRCIDFAVRFGFGGILVYNLFSRRSTDPKCLLELPYVDAVGCGGNALLRDIPSNLTIVCAWGCKSGALGKLIDRRAKEAVAVLAGRLMCLGIGRNGHPLHPLMQPKNAALKPFSMPEEETK